MKKKILRIAVGVLQIGVVCGLLLLFLKSLSLAQETGNKVSLREDGLLMVNNQPFFPLGVYGPYGQKSAGSWDCRFTWETLADSQFNVFVKDDANYLQEAEKYSTGERKIYGMITLGLVHESEEKTQELVNFVKPHPNFLAYVGKDEANYFWAEGEIGPPQNYPGYEYIEKNDPNHLLYQDYFKNEDYDSYIKPWTEGAFVDIAAPNVSPLEKARQIDNLKQPGQMVDKFKNGNLTGLDNPNAVWIVLKAFHPSTYYTPSLTEHRFMVYDAIVHGAKGILYYGLYEAGNYYCSLSDKFDEQPVWLHLQEISQEIASSDINSLLTTQSSWKVGLDNQNIKILPRKVDDVLFYLLAVNEAEDSQKAVFSGLGANEKIEVLFEDREIFTDDQGRFSDEFEGFGVHIYKIKRDKILPLTKLLARTPNGPRVYNEAVNNYLFKASQLFLGFFGADKRTGGVYYNLSPKAIFYRLNDDEQKRIEMMPVNNPSFEEFETINDKAIAKGWQIWENIAFSKIEEEDRSMVVFNKRSWHIKTLADGYSGVAKDLSSLAFSPAKHYSIGLYYKILSGHLRIGFGGGKNNWESYSGILKPETNMRDAEGWSYYLSQPFTPEEGDFNLFVYSKDEQSEFIIDGLQIFLTDSSSPQILLSQPGEYKLEYYSKDLAGNQESANLVEFILENIVGDLNNDGQVDIEDAKLLLSSFFTANFDLNADSLVNGVDFARMRKEIR